MFTGLFLGSVLFHLSLSLSSLILHCLDYDSFIGLKPAGVNVLTILIFQNSFGSFSSLAFP